MLGGCGIIIDLSGTAEECFALSLALANRELDIRGITVCSGKLTLEQATTNVAKVVSLFRGDRPNLMVYKGSNNPFASQRNQKEMDIFARDEPFS